MFDKKRINSFVANANVRIDFFLNFHIVIMSDVKNLGKTMTR